MNLWLISQTDVKGWDTFDSAVVAAETEEEAKLMYPGNGDDIRNESGEFWTKRPELVTAILIGNATNGIEKGVVCASFHAG